MQLNFGPSTLLGMEMNSASQLPVDALLGKKVAVVQATKERAAILRREVMIILFSASSA